MKISNSEALETEKILLEEFQIWLLSWAIKIYNRATVHEILQIHDTAKNK